MFKGQVVWRGIVYTVLMMFGKVITGIWLVQINIAPPKILQNLGRISRTTFSFCFQSRTTSQRTNQTPSTKKNRKNRLKKNQGSQSQEGERSNQDQGRDQGQQSTQMDSAPNTTTTSTPRLPPKPRSLYPASILGLAMVARGEIGYLIASIAETDGVFSSGQGQGQDANGSSELYLVVVWAITLCTILGPICVGTLVKRVRKLTASSGSDAGREYQNPLGIWGVTS